MSLRPPPPADTPPEALRLRLAGGEPITLLDVREPFERSLAAIPAPAPAAELVVPLREVPSRLDALREAAVRGPLVVYCHHGVRSRQAARWLAAQGLAGVENLEGGIDAWSLRADPAVPRY